MNERKARALIEQHFVEALPPAKFKALWAHVSACRACREHYDRLFGLEARLDGGKAEAERIGTALFAELEPRPRKLLDGIFAFTWPFPRVIAAGAVALALGLVVVPQLLRRPGPEGIRSAPEEFSARGEGGEAFGPTLLAACFRDVGGRPEGVQPLDGQAVAPVCPRGGRIALAYRDAREGDQLAVLAQRGGEVGVLVWPTPLKAGPGKTPLPGSFAIDPDSPAGEVRLLAVFAPAPEAARIQSALAEGREAASAAGAGAVVRVLPYRLEKK